MINETSSLNNSVKGGLPLLINATQAAKMLGISPRNLWTLTRAGTIPHVRLGLRVMYSHNGLHEAVAKNTFTGGTKNGEHN
jgi:hypothetical protein